MKASEWKAAVRILVYPVQFSKDPELEVDRVIGLLFGPPGTARSRDDFARAVRIALASEVSLAGLIPQEHSEEVVRGYLGAVLKKLAG